MSAFNPKKILVATDLTPASETAVASAADLAETLRAEAILFSAVSPIVFVDYGVFDDDTMKRSTYEQSRKVEAKLRDGGRAFPAACQGGIRASGRTAATSSRPKRAQRAEWRDLATQGALQPVGDPSVR